jgi:hypothetical protein
MRNTTSLFPVECGAKNRLPDELRERTIFFAELSDAVLKMVNGADGKSDIEGKAAMGSGERAGKRTSFKWAGAHESIGKRTSFNAMEPTEDQPGAEHDQTKVQEQQRHHFSML